MKISCLRVQSQVERSVPHDNVVLTDLGLGWSHNQVLTAVIVFGIVALAFATLSCSS